ncbi:hypothetical protein EMIHUDRAFT_52859, partial [Emiliania huxleyi CCMP1516]|uniref:Kinesin-like protein n=2 Tax=Emiliania huxleyi TaxID=2903 RepID=A0A0D3KG65_EMIH1
ERRRRRLLQNQLQELKGSIRVMCRVRPTAAGEGAAVVTIPTPTDVLVAQPGTREGRRSFAFDQAFGPGSGQEAVFEEVEPCVESVLDGFNVCIFAYGQTGSGKTFTMEGSSREEGLAGINPRALRRLFEMIAERKQLAAMGGRGGGESGGWEYAVSLSYLEIYNENLRDLLGDVPAARAGGAAAAPKKGKERASLDIRSTGEQVQVLGLSSLQADLYFADEVEEALRRGGGRRSVAATKCNASSSRSHPTLDAESLQALPSRRERRHAPLHLVDLAGSERVKKSDVSGQATGMLEAQAINKSLSALGNVMAKLQEKAKHVPFRDSKLTQLLADSLGGNSKTFMFVNINPSA